MHIPDGFLDARVSATTWALAGAAMAGALRGDRRDPVPAPAAVLGALAAFVFAAQAVNVPIAPGTSGHLIGATLVAMLLGPWRSLVVMAVVLAIQALLFQDGGILAYGANLLDMGVAGSFVGYAVASIAAGRNGGLRGLVIGGALGAFAATLCGAVLSALWLALSGLYPLRGILPLMLMTHAAIGVLEAVLTSAILVTLLRWRPDIVSGDGASSARRPAAIAIGLLGLAVLIAAFAAPFASRLPDGLERTAMDLGFAARANPVGRALLGPSSPFADSVGKVGPLLAGVAGTLLVATVGWLAARGLSRLRELPHR